MEKKTIEEKGSLIIFSVLIIMLMSSLFFTICPKVLNKFNLTNDFINNFFEIVVDDANIINVDYEKMYPFAEVRSDSLSFIEKYRNLINSIESQLKIQTSEHIFKYEKLIEASYVYNNILKFNLNSNLDSMTISLGNNYFSTVYSKKNIDNQINNIIEFSKYLNDLNINFLYVQAPFKISNDFDLSPVYKDSTDIVVDKFLNSIDGKVNYLDLRKQIREEKLDNLSLFFETDHHWLPETGLWATKVISNYLNEKYFINLLVNNLNIDNYNYKKYKKIFLGSAGRKVSLANAKPEDFTLITPKFDTKLHVLIDRRNINKTGTYSETLIDWSQLKYGNYYKTTPYGSYMYGDQPLIEIHNELINNNKKILLVKDSFSRVVAPFLSLENEYLSVIDLRHFNGSLKTYIKKYNPDIVIVIYNGNVISMNNSSEEMQNLWDFE